MRYSDFNISLNDFRIEMAEITPVIRTDGKDREERKEEEEEEAPDGGWGWCVVLGRSFLKSRVSIFLKLQGVFCATWC